MPLRVPHLRRWFAASAIALICIVAGFYFYARHRVRNALKEVPEKIGIEIQQSAKGFTISKSFQGRTLFKIEASKAVQFKAGGRGELHDVEITVYGRDSGRFDRITGQDFEYDAVSGDVIGKGEVQIDLETNPAGLITPDQSPPKDLKNPVHLKTSDLIFNQKTGDAHATGEVDFSVPQARGSGVGLTYIAQNNVLTLNSQVAIVMNGIVPMSLTADRLTLSRVPRELILEHPHVVEGYEHSSADKATAYLSPDNKLERVAALGNVIIDSDRPDGGKIRAGQMDLFVSKDNQLRQAVLQKDVRFTSASEGNLRASAGRAQVNLSTQAKVKNIHADLNVVLSQAADSKSGTQSFKITAPVMDFVMTADGHLIRSAETSGPPKIKFSTPDSKDQTEATAGKFQATFDNRGQLATLHGAPDVKIVSKVQGKPDRITTSQSLDSKFLGGRIATFTQTGDFAYSDGQIKAFAGTAQYDPQNEVLTLQRSPRITDGGFSTTANTIRLNRLSGTAVAEGDVRTTDISNQSKSTGGLFSSTSPVHVTAQTLTASSDPATAIYQGHVRLWQNAQSVSAPYLKIDRAQQTLKALRNANQRVSAKLSHSNKGGKETPVDILANRLDYSDRGSVVRFDGEVKVSSQEVTMSAENIQCYINKQSDDTKNKGSHSSQNLDRIEASGKVILSQPGRRATGNHLVYTAADDKYVLTGGSPSIFDAERGNVTGDSLTLFGHDARVLVEGSKQAPAVTNTRVAR